MKRSLSLALMAGIILVILTGCAGPAPQPLTFQSAPWSDGEVNAYDLKDKNGAAAGTAAWTWRRGPDAWQWTQEYELKLGGRLDRGQVIVDAALRPVSSWRETGGLRFDATYATDTIVIVTTAADGKQTTKTLKPVADGLDNDETLQVQRALPLAAGYATRYTDIIPTSGAAAPIILSVIGAETITVPAGTFPCWRVVMDFGSGKHDGWYGQAAPYPLVKYVNRTSGAAFELRSITASGVVPAASASPAAPAQPAPSGPSPLNVPFVLASALIQYPLMILLPILLGWWLHRRYRVGWGVWLAGAGTFIFSQIVHLPLNYALGLLGGGRGVALWPLIPMALVAGLSSGICEEGARWLVLTFLAKKTRSWRAGLQFGAGHGGAEAIILGLLVLVNFVAMIALRSLDPALLKLVGATADQVQAAAAQYWAQPWYMPIVAGLERVFAITLQITMALLVVRAVARKQIAYFLAAVGLHTVVDFWAVWAGSTLGTVWVEAGVAIVAAACFWLILRLREEPVTPAAEPAPSPAPVPTTANLAPRILSAEELARRAEESRYE
ncbi:MAG: YhfC family glutamic-type intramembrane protease [Chloroflexi bacterium]|nr:YhfC family glutamic-type intramembrane protease [Chloroflexota bacterium]